MFYKIRLNYLAIKFHTLPPTSQKKTFVLKIDLAVVCKVLLNKNISQQFVFPLLSYAVLSFTLRALEGSWLVSNNMLNGRNGSML